MARRTVAAPQSLLRAMSDGLFLSAATTPEALIPGTAPSAVLPFAAGLPPDLTGGHRRHDPGRVGLDRIWSGDRPPDGVTSLASENPGPAAKVQSRPSSADPLR